MLASIFIIGIFFIFGYCAQLARNVIAGEQYPLPSGTTSASTSAKACACSASRWSTCCRSSCLAFMFIVPSILARGQPIARRCATSAAAWRACVWCLLFPLRLALAFWLPARAAVRGGRAALRRGVRVRAASGVHQGQRRQLPARVRRLAGRRAASAVRLRSSSASAWSSPASGRWSSLPTRSGRSAAGSVAQVKRDTEIVAATLVAISATRFSRRRWSAPAAIAHGASMRWRLLFRLFCHGIPQRCLYLWDMPMPICARCTAIYVGLHRGIAAVSASLPRMQERTARIRLYVGRAADGDRRSDAARGFSREHESAAHGTGLLGRSCFRHVGFERDRKAARGIVHDSLTSCPDRGLRFEAAAPQIDNRRKWPSRDRSKNCRCPTSFSWSASRGKPASSRFRATPTAASSI